MRIHIDAEKKILGRLASEISIILMGKHKPDYVPYKITGTKVVVSNIDKLAISGNKLEQKKYFRHSGYVGHLTSRPMKEFSKKELLRRAVWYMLPKNKLRTSRTKILTVSPAVALLISAF